VKTRSTSSPTRAVEDPLTIGANATVQPLYHVRPGEIPNLATQSPKIHPEFIASCSYIHKGQARAANGDIGTLEFW
jgi:hypothetical protein